MKETTDDKTIGLADLDSEENQQLELWFDDSVEMAHGFKISIKIKDVLFSIVADPTVRDVRLFSDLAAAEEAAFTYAARYQGETYIIRQ